MPSQHRSLQPTGPPGPAMGSGPGASSRLLEMLDGVKQEFDLIGQDNSNLRAQKQEYELKGMSGVSPLEQIQTFFFS